MPSGQSPIFDKTQMLLVWLLPHTEKFPHAEKVPHEAASRRYCISVSRTAAACGQRRGQGAPLPAGS